MAWGNEQAEMEERDRREAERERYAETVERFQSPVQDDVIERTVDGAKVTAAPQIYDHAGRAWAWKIGVAIETGGKTLVVEWHVNGTREEIERHVAQVSWFSVLIVRKEDDDD